MNIFRCMFGLALAAALFAIVLIPNLTIPSAYWIWAGISVKNVPAKAPAYIYQGIFLNQHKHLTFERKGLYPHPIEQREIYLVFRIEGSFLQNDEVPHIIQSSIAAWERHGVKITGIQLDVDTATSQLLEYGDYLKWIRTALPLSYQLSITGLGDWILWGNPAAITHISSSVNEIVFQLYQGRQSFPNTNQYLKRLHSFNVPFKVGLLPENTYASPVSLFALRFNPVFKGIVYFVQK